MTNVFIFISFSNPKINLYLYPIQISFELLHDKRKKYTQILRQFTRSQRG